LFGYYILDKQNKVTRLQAKKNGSSSTILPSPLKGEGIKPVFGLPVEYMR
jgi:hypothetical protein